MTAVLDRTAASLARRLGNAIASDGDPHQCQVWDSALVDAVDAARAHGLPLASVVAALQREVDEGQTCRDCHGVGWVGPALDGEPEPCPRCDETGVEGIR